MGANSEFAFRGGLYLGLAMGIGLTVGYDRLSEQVALRDANPHDLNTPISTQPAGTQHAIASQAFTDALNTTTEDGAPFRVEVYDRCVAPSSPPVPGGMD